MPRQPDDPGERAGVAIAFARLQETLERRSNRGKPGSARQKIANQRMQEAVSAFGAVIGQSAAASAPSAHAGKTIDPERAIEPG